MKLKLSSHRKVPTLCNISSGQGLHISSRGKGLTSSACSTVSILREKLCFPLHWHNIHLFFCKYYLLMCTKGKKLYILGLTSRIPCKYSSQVLIFCRSIITSAVAVLSLGLGYKQYSFTVAVFQKYLLFFCLLTEVNRSNIRKTLCFENLIQSQWTAADAPVWPKEVFGETRLLF